MKCPKCGNNEHKVRDTDSDYDETIERLRKCRQCGFRFETQETYKNNLVKSPASEKLA